ncbi:putative enzyme [Desulfosarcina cetonica]|uniref:S66 peptidase family protein n=1 Tax=Desulfosarcina cetonica TaxID=90730 RepID=UPI0006D0318C|nr:LD-carboxypeptidase [Desulfosarcina cetonica]VTR71353.1 putative enzyme [Desulfosarcina cetonica]
MTDDPHPSITRPIALRPGDTLGIAAPASPFAQADFDTGVQLLEAMGFNVFVPNDIFLREGYLAGSDRQRAEQLVRLFTDPEIHGVVCARGGYGAMRILPFLDADAIARHPKPFVGFSDITVILNFLAQRCRMVAFHGPTVTTLANGDDNTRQRFRSVLMKRMPHALAAAAPRVLFPGRARGRLLCGNLTLFCHLTGTPYQPVYEGAVLLIEDQGEAPYRIDRMLTQMRLAGCFDKLAGLALGSFNGCDSEGEVQRIVADRFGDLEIPILGGFHVGHGPENAILPVGIDAVLDTDAGSLTFTGPALA